MKTYKISARKTRIIVNTPDRPDEDVEMAVDVNHADLARLLSAAPDLLSVLESIVARTKPAHLFEGITIAPTVEQIQAAKLLSLKLEANYEHTTHPFNRRRLQLDARLQSRRRA